MTGPDPDAPDGADVAPDEAPDTEPHRDDGLDLARDLTRSTAATPAAEARRRRRGPTRRKPAPSDGTPTPGGFDRTGGWSGPGPDERDPKPLAGAVERLVADRGWALDLRVRGVFARWEELVGPQVAAHTTPETLVDGVLVVQSDSTAWATELRLLAPAVVRAVCAELGDGTVTAVEVRGPRAPGRSPGRLRVRGRGPRDTYG